MEFINRVYSTIDNFFPELERKRISHIINDGEVNIELFYRGYCLEINLDKNEPFLYIISLQKCGYSGTKILENLELYANSIDEVKYIKLEDASHIALFGQDEYAIPLYYLHILAKGQSWYNTLGYKQSMYDEEKLQWDQLRRQPMFLMFEKFMVIDYSDHDAKDAIEILSRMYNRNISINECILFIKQIWFDIYNQDISIQRVSTVYSMIYVVIKSKNIDLKDNIKVAFYLLLTLMFPFINYDGSELIKYIK